MLLDTNLSETDCMATEQIMNLSKTTFLTQGISKRLRNNNNNLDISLLCRKVNYNFITLNSKLFL